MSGQAVDTGCRVGSADLPTPRCAWRLTVRGNVQGTGFRPHVYRLAQRCGVHGTVRNVAHGVEINVEGPANALEEFRLLLEEDAPPAAAVESVTIETTEPQGCAGFTIHASDPSAALQVRVLPDLATCNACRTEIVDPTNRRYRYPFTSCTECGPRYSIIARLPYDRPATAMVQFAQCGECLGEYRNPDNRRFHAQANACPACGPQLALWDRQGQQVAGPPHALAHAANLLQSGRVLALKGLGGFQLVARASDAEAVRQLRLHKNRPTKPFAVMVGSMREALALASLGPVERQLLASPENPIVLAERRHNTHAIAAEVAPRLSTVGLFLPTTPLHHLLLAAAGGPLIVTSGNRGDEPIVTDEHEAPRQLAGLADGFLVHDRPILRRLDDSVVRVINGKPTVFRLARGYAPLAVPVLERFSSTVPTVATGGHQKVAIALWTGQQAVLAQHVGDMDTAQARAAFTAEVSDLSALYRCQPAAIACDLHPDYFTTRWANSQTTPVIAVQHHYAHAVACMAEHDLLDREVLAFTWDGTGYGPDGTIWGCEVLRATASGFRRIASLRPFPLPGGEAAIRHPHRIALSLLVTELGAENACQPSLLRLLGLEPSEAGVLANLCIRPKAAPWTSSIGRLFDAVAALVLGIRDVSYEGEAAILLEAIADPTVMEAYELPLRWDGESSIPRGDWAPLLRAILADRDSDVLPGTIAARFHNALARWAQAVADAESVTDVVLTGGCFQNRLLAERTREALNNKRVHLHGTVPPGDGGLAVGQLAVALNGMQGKKTS